MVNKKLGYQKLKGLMSSGKKKNVWNILLNFP